MFTLEKLVGVIPCGNTVNLIDYNSKKLIVSVTDCNEEKFFVFRHYFSSVVFRVLPCSETSLNVYVVSDGFEDL